VAKATVSFFLYGVLFHPLSFCGMKKVLSFVAVIAIAGPALAQDYGFKNSNRVIEPQENTEMYDKQRFNLHMQATYILQYKPAFNSPYESKNSLAGNEADENSLTATLFFGARLWKGADIYINPEIAGGSGLNGALGMAGSSNGETFRVGNPAPSLYLGRAYFRQTFSLAKKATMGDRLVGDDQNQLSGYEPVDYLRFYIGKLSLGDLFDGNEYSNSPRTQFMNWAVMNNGAWDYAANIRGYTYTFAAELQQGKMNYKLAAATMAEVANGPDLNTDIGESIALNGQISRSITIKGRPGNIRLLGYYNTAAMGNYEHAVVKAVYDNDTPNVDAIGKKGNNKYGFGISFDQELTDTWGLFARAGWNDGLNQSWSFTEIDQTLSVGVLANGEKWKRPNDKLGIALAGNGISANHQRYLAFGGYGFILGDGALNYAPELIGELFYSYRPFKKTIWFTGDYQLCVNPGYNADRGPVSIFSLRVHAEL
jgi:high affinity Mn2+ porin